MLRNQGIAEVLRKINFYFVAACLIGQLRNKSKLYTSKIKRENKIKKDPGECQKQGTNSQYL